jgi:hypothetical protein
MSYVELLDLLLPIALTAAIGLATALFGSVLLSARRLRQELSVDSETLGRLPPGPDRDDFEKEIHRRTYLLVAYMRDPALTRPELIALVGILAVAALGVAGVWDEQRHEDTAGGNPLAVSAFIVAVTGGIWVFYARSWVPRSLRRIDYIFRHLGKEDAAESAYEAIRVTRVAAWLAICWALACLMAPLVYLVFGTDVSLGDEVSRETVQVGVVLLGLAFVGLNLWLFHHIIGGSTTAVLHKLLSNWDSSAGSETSSEASQELRGQG